MIAKLIENYTKGNKKATLVNEIRVIQNFCELVKYLFISFLFSLDDMLSFFRF